MRITDQQRRSLHLALASARNKLAQLHQRFALERVAALPHEEPAAVLREYDRMHSLGKAEAESLANRALASFGVPRVDEASAPLLPPPAPPRAEGRFRRWFDSVLRRRHPDLRTWLSLHVAHTEAVLLGAHAMHVIELLETIDCDIEDMPSVIDFYVRETKTRGALREPITVIALDRLYRRRAAEATGASNDASSRAANSTSPRAANGRSAHASDGVRATPSNGAPSRAGNGASTQPPNGATASNPQRSATLRPNPIPPSRAAVG